MDENDRALIESLHKVQSSNLRVEMLCPKCGRWFDTPPGVSINTLCVACKLEEEKKLLKLLIKS